MSDKKCTLSVYDEIEHMSKFMVYDTIGIRYCTIGDMGVANSLKNKTITLSGVGKIIGKTIEGELGCIFNENENIPIIDNNVTIIISNYYCDHIDFIDYGLKCYWTKDMINKESIIYCDEEENNKPMHLVNKLDQKYFVYSEYLNSLFMDYKLIIIDCPNLLSVKLPILPKYISFRSDNKELTTPNEIYEFTKETRYPKAVRF